MKLNSIRSKRDLLHGLSFVLGFQAALIAYVTSNFIKENAHTSAVGLFYFLGYVGALFVLFQMHHLIYRYGKSQVFFWFLLFKMFSLVGVAFFASEMWGTIFVVLVLMSGQLMWTAMDVIIETFSSNKVTGTIRGMHLAIMNGGWLLAPLVAARIVDSWGYQWVYAIAAGLAGMVLLVAWWKFRGINHQPKRDLNLRQILHKMYKNPDITRIYYVSLLLEIFYAAMVVYAPIYLLNLGFHWSEIGWIFTVMLVPFVVLQYPLGLLADRKTGEKEWLIAAIVIMAASTAMVSLITTADLFIWMIVLFLTRVGAAIIEVLRDSYFYKQVGSDDVDLIDMYRTTRSVSYLFVTGLFSVLLFLLPIRWIFLILAGLVATGFIALINLKDSK